MKKYGKNNKNNEKNLKKTKENRKNGAIIGLSIATGILSLSTVGLGIGYSISMQKVNDYGLKLESVYKRNYYELVENVNAVDMKVSKLLASNSETYQAKMLTEISQNAKEMQSNIASLPLSSDSIYQSVQFINQMGGYTQVLEEKITNGGELDESDLETLNSLHETLTEMKVYLNRMSQDMMHGYSILDASLKNGGSFDEFTTEFMQIKNASSDYPSMIYDGPFSDSVVNQQVKGLNGELVSKEDAYQKVDKTFKNISNLKYLGETSGKFNTYNFSLLNSDGKSIYVQISKIGGHILTVSGNVESDVKNVSFEQAEKLATDFAKDNGVDNATVVWSAEIGSQIYFNIAPKQDGVVLYPDLVKVKVDLEFGDVIGYDAIPYFTNHTERSLSQATYGKENALNLVDDSFEVVSSSLVLAPLDYNREVLCYEFECRRDGATYYIYVNASTGEEENILKVVETDDGAKLM